ncbi:hypothetical protein COB55_03255 [Candidatus Wolfebacteria bacterium]|nr:MAG: hypothetical protein COB55_03255 [Candidatus Wolfebacteria bacterium]
MAVDDKLDTLAEMSSIYILIDDCLQGEKQIKLKQETYLPKPNKADVSQENTNRYAAYLERAVFYNVTRRTLTGLNGQVFMRKPLIKLPPQLEPMIANVNGFNTLMQEAKKLNTDVLSFGRAGLLTDYPNTDDATTVAQLKSGDVRPTIIEYHPLSIINWRVKTRGALIVLSLVVIEEEFPIDDDGFTEEFEKQYRVLDLDDDDEYRVRIFRETTVVDEATGKEFQDFRAMQEYIPKNSDGDPFNEIPFTFVGSENNDPEIDFPPMYDIAAINIAHYRNSADYEESAFIVGQPTPVFSGLTESWVDEYFKGGKVQLGSRVSVPLPEGGTATLLQPLPNTMPFEAMKLKEGQMIALGAKLIQPTTVERTATEANMEKSAENSILASTAKNVSEAIEKAFVWAAQFVGAPEDDIKFELPTEFDLATMSPEERRQLLEEWLSGIISTPEIRTALKKSGLAFEDDKLIQEELDRRKEEERKLLEQKQTDTLPNGGEDNTSSTGEN